MMAKSTPNTAKGTSSGYRLGKLESAALTAIADLECTGTGAGFPLILGYAAGNPPGWAEHFDSWRWPPSYHCGMKRAVRRLVQKGAIHRALAGPIAMWRYSYRINWDWIQSRRSTLKKLRHLQDCAA